MFYRWNLTVAVQKFRVQVACSTAQIQQTICIRPKAYATNGRGANVSSALSGSIEKEYATQPLLSKLLKAKLSSGSGLTVS